MSQQYRKIYWTDHSKLKMRQYGISKTKVLSVLAKPDRREQSIVPGTEAVMRTNILFSTAKIKKPSGEIWLMYQDIKNKGLRKIISAWRYPGISKPGEEIPIPEEIRRELINNGIQ